MEEENIYRHIDSNAITGETTVEERPFTQAELDQQAQAELDRIAQLNALTPMESTITSLSDAIFSLMDDIDTLKAGV